MPTLAWSFHLGDDFNQRFGSHADILRVNIKGSFLAGSTAAASAQVRITCFTGETGLAFAANMQGTFSPVADNTAVRLLYDKFLTIPSTIAGAGFPVDVNISIKTRHRQKFTGSGTGTQTGTSLYLIMQSGAGAGTGAPTFDGVVEVFFKP